MAKQLIPEDLQALIDQYLTDGVLTDKERAVILKKAEGMGLDRDEIDLYLDAEVQKIDQATDAAARKQKGKQCPYCGGSIPQLTDKCPHCGENITAEASSELQEIFNNLEDALVNLKSGMDVHASKASVERFARKAKMYFGNNPKIQKLLAEIEVETVNAEKKGKAIARNQTIANILKKYWYVLLAIIVAIVAACLWLGPDVKNDPQACIEAVKKAVDKGNLEKAAGLCKGFVNKHPLDGEDIGNAFTMTAKAYVDEGKYDQALSLLEGVNMISEIEISVRKEIVKKCVDEGEFDKAEDYGNFRYDGYARYFDYMCQCIDYMKNHNESLQKIKSFIDRKINTPDPSYGKWDPKSFPAKLYEYADLTPNTAPTSLSDGWEEASGEQNVSMDAINEAIENAEAIVDKMNSLNH